jgi:integrase
VSDVVGPYLAAYELDHRGREQSILSARNRLAQVKRLLGNSILSDLTEDAIRGYMGTRLAEGVSGRTVNMEVGELSRAIGKPWSTLWPNVRKQEERKDVGVALSPEEEQRLLEASSNANRRSSMAPVILRLALFTGMRIGEVTSLTWGQVDLNQRVVTVGKAKTESGTGRQIPMNDDLFALLSMHAEWFIQKFGATCPEYYLFPFGKPSPTDPTRPITTLKTVWNSIRKEANVKCRIHDLRHTVATKMAEAGVPESTMLDLLGHMSKAMLRRYSHIRMVAKREAVKCLSTKKAKETPPAEQGYSGYKNGYSRPIQGDSVVAKSLKDW